MPVIEIESESTNGYWSSEDDDYTIAHDAATAPLPFPQSILFVGQTHITTIGRKYRIRRAGFFFDTSILPDDVELTRAVLSLYVALLGRDVNYDVVIVSGGDLDSGGLVEADYGELLNEEISRGLINSSDLVQGAYNDILLNAIGRSEISKTGITAFALRSSRDINSIEPIEPNSERVGFQAQGETNPPKLIITYGIPGHIWVGNRRLHFIDEYGQHRSLEGIDTNVIAEAGHLWVEGAFLHYFDETAGEERGGIGTKLGATGQTAGFMWVEGSELHYIDNNGDERYLPVGAGMNAQIFNQVGFNG